MFDEYDARSVPPVAIAEHIGRWLDAKPARARCTAFAHGSRWYLEANEIAHDMATGARSLSVAQAAGVLSAFSINCGWPENITRALGFANGEPARGLAVAIAKAESIATLPAPEAGHIAPVCNILAGDKTRHFARAIFRPEDESASAPVVLDVHMWRMLGYSRSHGERVNYHDGERHRLYDVVADGFRLLAKDFHVTPATLQAAVWILQRGHATEPSYGRRYEAEPARVATESS